MAIRMSTGDLKLFLEIQIKDVLESPLGNSEHFSCLINGLQKILKLKVTCYHKYTTINNHRKTSQR